MYALLVRRRRSGTNPSQANTVLSTFANIPAVIRQRFARKDSKDGFEQARITGPRSIADLQQVRLLPFCDSRVEVQPADLVIETCSGPTSTNRPRSLYPSGSPQNSCRRPSTLESHTGCSSSSVTSSEDSISGSGTSREAESESSCPETGRTIPSTRGCCLFLIIPLGPETDSPIPASTKTTVSLRLKL